MGWQYTEVVKAYNNWIQIFRIKNSTLTFEQYLYKMHEVKIRPFDIGMSLNEQYQLSRYNDEGPYTNQSCRFILAKLNLEEEKKESPYFRSIKKYGIKKARKIQSKNGRLARLGKASDS